MKSFEEHLAVEEYKAECQKYAAIKRRRDRRLSREELKRTKRINGFAIATIIWAIVVCAVVINHIITQNKPLDVQEHSGRVLAEVPVETIVEEEPVATEYATFPESGPKFVSLGEFTITHYCPCEKCCGQWADGITYTSTKATADHTIAVDPDVIPLGSTVVIDGHEYVAEDTGGAIKGNRIDIFMDNHETALDEGVKTAEVYLMEVNDALEND